ncbi:MAG: hypothetical protein IJ526_04595 [Lachnospiraceae bacterium]|nr:hypothetical protein [Lachnospiraceae bacterium]
MDNQPKKHKDSYGTEIIRSAVMALRFCQMGNTEFYNERTATEEMYHFRRENFKKALGCIENVATMAEIYFEIVRKNGTLENEKVYKWEKRIGDACNTSHDLINGLIESDKKVYHKLKAKR